MEEVYTDKQAQEVLHVSRTTLWRLRDAGKLAFVRIGSRTLYRASDLEEFLESQARPVRTQRVLNATGRRVA